MVGMTEFDSIGDDLVLCIAFDQLEIVIQVQGGPNVEAFLGAVVPRALGGRLGMDMDATSYWFKRGLVEIKGGIEELPHGDLRVEGSLSQKIESELCLWREKVPKEQGKGWIYPSQDGKEVVLEGPNQAVSTVTVMHVWGH